MLPQCELKETEGKTSCIKWVAHERMIGRRLQGIPDDCIDGRIPMPTVKKES